MKKILFIVSTLKRTGPIIVLANIIKYLNREHYEPQILTLSPEPENSMKDFFEKTLNTKINSLQLSRIQGMLKGKALLNDFIKTQNIDIIHSHGLRADSLMKSLSVNYFMTLHNYPYYDYPMKFGKLKGRLMAHQHLKAIQANLTGSVACSKSISKEFLNRHNLNIQYIQNGVDTELFFPLKKEEKHNLRKKLHLPLNKKILISVGSLIPRKNMSVLIQAFKNYHQKNPDSLLLIAGEGYEKEMLKALANEATVFLGNINNVVQYLQASDMFISASLAEGLPNTVLEAMACGLPTLLSEIPSHREIWGDTSNIFFQPQNTAQLAQLLHTSEYGRSDEALQLINSKFNAKTMSEKYQKLYEKR